MSPRIESLRSWGFSPARGRVFGETLAAWLAHGVDGVGRRPSEWLNQKILREQLDLDASLVTLAERRPVAVALVRVEPWAKSEDQVARLPQARISLPYLSLLAVDPNWRNRGLARNLLQYIHRDLANPPHVSSPLCVLAEPQLQDFYHLQGFAKEATYVTLGRSELVSPLSPKQQSKSSSQAKHQRLFDLCTGIPEIVARSPAERQRHWRSCDPYVHMQATVEGTALVVHSLLVQSPLANAEGPHWPTLIEQLEGGLAQLQAGIRQHLMVGCGETHPFTRALIARAWRVRQRFAIMRCRRTPPLEP